MQRIATCVFLIIGLVAGCDSAPDVVELSGSEADLFASVGIDLDTGLQIRRNGDSVNRLQGIDENWETVDADGVVLQTPRNQGEATLRKLRSLLDGERYAAYLLDQGFGFGPDSVAILADTNPYAYLEIVKTNGVNYDVEHADVIERLQDWDEMYGLQLTGAGMDWLLAEFARPPQDWNAFAQEVYEFCPDVVEQGTGSVEALASELRQINGVYLWWD